MKTRLARWGNSLAVRIPKPIAQAAQFRAGEQLELASDGPGSVRIRKRKRKPTLADFLREITPANLHEETEWGEVVGKETW